MLYEENKAASLKSAIGHGTEKLYYTDAYMKEFDAVVLHCKPVPGSAPEAASPLFHVVLDRTAFFPEEGGQSPDRGILTDGQTAQVSDVQIRDGVITHVTDIPFKPGTQVHGVLDFRHRFSNMQQHSAEHLYSGLVYSRLGLVNKGFHLSDSEVTMDYSGPISEEEAASLEMEVNRLIWKNIESRQEFPSPEELKSYDYRSKTAIDGQVRLVIFPGCDICACCAPHVARTGEIGLFKVISVQSHRGGVRIHMLAGERAFRFLADGNAILTEAARSLSTSPEKVPGLIGKLRTDLYEARHALSEAKLALLLKEADEIPVSERDVCLFTDSLEEPVLREAVNRLMTIHDGVCGIFNGNDTEGYRYVIGSTTDVLTMQKCLKDELQARGGGRPPMIQGQIHASRSAVEELFFRKHSLCDEAGRSEKQ